MSDDRGDGGGKERRSGLWGLGRRGLNSVKRVTGTPAQAVGWRSLIGGLNLIEDLWRLFRSRHRPDRAPLVPYISDSVDLRARAQFRGIGEEEFLALITRRQRETFFTAIAAASLDVALFVLWTVEMIFGHWTGSRILAAISFVPFLVMLGYISLHNCSMNWQLRSRRVASMRQFFDESDTLFPRLP